MMAIPCEQFHENVSVARVNALDDRAYYLPSDGENLCGREKVSTDRLLLLNGEWDFRHYNRFMDAKLDGDGDWARVPVPSVWQLQGYDSCQYTNIPYSFPFDPPYVPAAPPAGCIAAPLR